MKINKPEDIALVFPPHRLKEIRYSLGLLYISGYLRDHGFDNIIVSHKILGPSYKYQGKEKTGVDIVNKIIEIKPKIVGFTASTIEIHEVIKMNKKIKEAVDCISIIGGPHVTAAPREVLEKGLDIAVIGEGEQTVLELIRELEKESPDLTAIKGIAFKKENGEVVINPSRDLIEIADLSLPAYDKIKMSHHLQVSDEVLRGVPVKAAIVMASRGCPYRCTFCACNKVFGHQVRYRSFENIKKEVDLLKNKYHAEAIWFADDTMTISYEHVEKICQLMKEEKMIWGAQSRVDLTREDIVRKMKASGCLQLDFGVESGSQRILDDIINKRIKLDQVEKAFALCRQYGIRTHAAFMLGLPTETRAEVIQTFEFAKKIKPNWYAFGIFTPLPGTYLYDNYYQPGEITLADYKDVTFHKPSKKFNKSQVEDLAELFDKWRKELFEGIKWRSLFHPLLFLKLFIILPNKLERADFLFFKFRRLIKYFLNKLGFNFSLSGRNVK